MRQSPRVFGDDDGRGAVRAGGARVALEKEERGGGEKKGRRWGGTHFKGEWREAREGGVRGQCPHGGGRRKERGEPGVATSGWGRPATATGRRARAAPCCADRGARGANRWAKATMPGGYSD
jgi:hypothetical protein